MNNIYISSRDIAENAKLNHEIAEELRKFKTNHQLSCSDLIRTSRSNKDSLATWIPVSGTGMTRIFCLTVFMLLPTLTQAEQCTPTPDCKSLGYTETSCSDGGGVKCPWNTNLMFCPQCKQQDICQSCTVGMILNSDMTCSPNKVSGKTPIGVILQQTITTVGAAIKCQGVAVALNDLSGRMTWGDANSNSNSYSVSGVAGWRLSTKDELLAVYSNSSAVSLGLSKAGGTQFTSDDYWSSSVYNNNLSRYWLVNPVSGGTDWGSGSANYGLYVRPVLDLIGLR